MRWFCSIIALVCGLTSYLGSSVNVARADDVHLTGGSVLHGRATRHGDKVVVEMDSGELTLPADSVERIDGGPSDVQKFEQLYAKVAHNDVKGLLQVADFCRDHAMPDREQQVLRQVLEADADNTTARARLGYVRTDAGWMKQEDQMRAQGYIKRDGAWVTREQSLELDRMQTDAEIAATERDKANVELETKRVELARKQDELAQERQRAADSERQRELAQQQAAMQPYYNNGYYTPYVRYAPAWNNASRHQIVTPVRNDQVYHERFPIAGVSDPWTFIRGH